MPKTMQPMNCQFCYAPLGLPRHIKQKLHKECRKKYKAKYQREVAYPKHKEYYIKYDKQRRMNSRNIVIQYYGGKCACCNEQTIEFLAIDHIGGGGCHHRKIIRNDNICAWIIRNNFPDGFRVLCHNCNSSYGYYGYCPHNQNK